MIMNCKECGKPIPESGKFCAFCGTPVPVEPRVRQFCANCGTKLVPDSRFCFGCGKPISPPSDPISPVVPVSTVGQPVVPEARVIPEVESIAPEADAFTSPVSPVDEPAVSVPPVVDPVVDPFADPVSPSANPFADPGPIPAPAPFEQSAATPSPKPKRKRRRIILPIILSVIAVVLVVAIVAGLLTNWFGFYGPAAKIKSAAEKTLKAENFTVVVTSSSEYDYDDIFGNDKKVRTKETTYEISIDFEKEDITVVGVDEEGNITSAIYNGYSIYYSELSSSYTCYDYSEEIEQIFTLYKCAEDKDFEKLLEEYLDEDEIEEIEEDINLKKLKNAIRSLYFKANNSIWLKENAGYSKESSNGMTVYTFNPDLYTLLDAVLDEFEDVFRDEDDFEELEDILDDERKNLRSNDITVSVGVKKGELAEITWELESDIFSSAVEMKFERIGTTGIDTDTLDSILEQAMQKGRNGL